jgi:hypothetical protein
MASVLLELASATLHRCHRACMHRLRGNTQVLGGWAELGMMQDDSTRIRDRVMDGQKQMARLEMLWTYAQQPIEQFFAQTEQAKFWQDAKAQEVDLAEIFLAAALRLGTPEEASHLLPKVCDPQAAWATSLWLESVLARSMSRQFACTDDTEGRLRLRLQGTELDQAPATLMQHYVHFLSPESMSADQLGVDTSIWVMGLTTQQPMPVVADQNAINPTAANPATFDKPQ